MPPPKDSILFYDLKKEHSLSQNFKPREKLRCAMCPKDFSPKKRYQLYCSDECATKDEKLKQEISDRLFWKQCKYCGIQFRKKEQSSGQTVCETCHKANIKTTYQKVSEIDRWVKQKKRKGLPLEEIIRRMEWKRVWDDEGWTHYLSGRKWDKI